MTKSIYYVTPALTNMQDSGSHSQNVVTRHLLQKITANENFRVFEDKDTAQKYADSISPQMSYDVAAIVTLQVEEDRWNATPNTTYEGPIAVLSAHARSSMFNEGAPVKIQLLCKEITSADISSIVSACRSAGVGDEMLPLKGINKQLPGEQQNNSGGCRLL